MSELEELRKYYEEAIAALSDAYGYLPARSHAELQARICIQQYERRWRA